MANELAHITLANRNHDALAHLLPDADRFPEWVATIAFYKAVQIVEAVFVTNLNQHSTSHHQRLLTLKIARFKAIFKDYRVLLSASRIARYLEDHGDKDQNQNVINPPMGVYGSFAIFMPCNEVVKELVHDRLRPLENNCVPFLSAQGKAALQRI
jgi:hypothetical protein